jgi:hypothetical protein
MKTKIINLLSAAALLVFYGCGWGENCTDCCDVEHVPRTVNPDLVKLPLKAPCALWLNDSLLCTADGLFVLNDKFTISNPPKLSGGYYFMYPNFAKDKFLFISNVDVATNTLYERVLPNITTRVLDEKVIAAVYYRSDDAIIYCTPNHSYYMWDRISDERTFLLSVVGNSSNDMHNINGFDVHSVRNKLLIPILTEEYSTLIIEYDMGTRQIDTLDFIIQGSGVWLRYNNVGDKILYSDVTSNEIGIMDVAAKHKKVLDTNTSLYANGRYVNIFPNWSSDDKHVIFGSSQINYCDGGRAKPELYILKNINK